MSWVRMRMHPILTLFLSLPSPPPLSTDILGYINAFIEVMYLNYYQ